MQAAATATGFARSLPPRRSKLQRSMDKLGAAMDGRLSVQIADVKEMRAWLAGRVFRGVETEVSDPRWRMLGRWVDRELDPHARRQWCSMLLAVLDVAGVELFHEVRGPLVHRNLVALRAMFHRRADWARSPGEWAPSPVGNEAAALASLARHLFVRWDMPRFMDEVWTHPNRRARTGRDFYAHIAAGRSLRTAPLPYRLTRRQAHLFMQAPDDGNFETALALADIVALGAEPGFARDLSLSELGRGLLMAPHQRAYWLSVARYFLQHPRLAQRHGDEVIDYLRQRMTRGARAGLRLHGREPAWLLEEVAAWHRSLFRAAISPLEARKTFPDPGIGDFAEEFGVEERETWRVCRIRNVVELREEGAAMSNCVFSYARACLSGQASIWSLRCMGEAGAERREATIRVAGGAILEAKARANRPIASEARAVIERWAERERLRRKV